MPELGMRRGIPLRAYIAYTHAHCRKERFYMKTKKFVSALAGMTIAAGMLSAFAVTASAQEVTLSYEKDGDALDSYTYTSASHDTYTLTQAGEDALKNAQEGDTVTVTYNINANSASRYRAGLKFIGHQFYTNAVTSSTIKTGNGNIVGILGKNSRFNSKDVNACHFNVAFDKEYSTAEVEYIIELNAGGTVAAVTPTVTFHGYELTYGKNIDPVAGNSLNELIFNTESRNNNDPKAAPTLTNFRAVLNTSYTEPEEPPTPEVTPKEATEYTPKEYVGEDKGYTVTLNGEGNAVKWYAKLSEDAAWTEIAIAQKKEQTIMSGDADYVVGLVITDIGDNSLKGYSFGAEMATAE